MRMLPCFFLQVWAFTGWSRFILWCDLCDACWSTKCGNMPSFQNSDSTTLLCSCQSQTTLQTQSCLWRYVLTTGWGCMRGQWSCRRIGPRERVTNLALKTKMHLRTCLEHMRTHNKITLSLILVACYLQVCRCVDGWWCYLQADRGTYYKYRGIFPWGSFLVLGSLPSFMSFADHLVLLYNKTVPLLVSLCHQKCNCNACTLLQH